MIMAIAPTNRLVLLCQNLREQISMNRSVVIHHSTAWCRSHWTTSRCTGGRVLRWVFGQGGKRVASGTLSCVTVSLPKPQPDQKGIGPHDRHGMPVKSRPQLPLVLIPAQFILGLLTKRLNRITPMGQADQLLDGGCPGACCSESTSAPSAGLAWRAL